MAAIIGTPTEEGEGQEIKLEPEPLTEREVIEVEVLEPKDEVMVVDPTELDMDEVVKEEEEEVTEVSVAYQIITTADIRVYFCFLLYHFDFIIGIENFSPQIFYIVYKVDCCFVVKNNAILQVMLFLTIKHFRILTMIMPCVKPIILIKVKKSIYVFQIHKTD